MYVERNVLIGVKRKIKTNKQGKLSEIESQIVVYDLILLYLTACLHMYLYSYLTANLPATIFTAKVVLMNIMNCSHVLASFYLRRQVSFTNITLIAA